MFKKLLTVAILGLSACASNASDVIENYINDITDLCETDVSAYTLRLQTIMDHCNVGSIDSCKILMVELESEKYKKAASYDEQMYSVIPGRYEEKLIKIDEEKRMSEMQRVVDVVENSCFDEVMFNIYRSDFENTVAVYRAGIK